MNNDKPALTVDVITQIHKQMKLITDMVNTPAQIDDSIKRALDLENAQTRDVVGGKETFIPFRK